ncbi:hypothetical protein CsSME_00044002 [Camellia sinensis var. sinensis]
MAKYVRYVAIRWGLQPAVMLLLLAMSVPSQFAGLVMNMSEKMEINHVLSARPDIRDTKGVLELMEMMKRMMLMTSKMSLIIPKEIALQDANGTEKMLTSLHLLDMNLNQFAFSLMGSRYLVKFQVLLLTTSLYELHQVLWALVTSTVIHFNLLIQGNRVTPNFRYSFEILPTFVYLFLLACHLTMSYITSVPVRIVDPSKDLNAYGLENVDWKERVEGWKLKQEKNAIQMPNKYTEGGKGDIEGTGSNGEELQMADDASQPLSRIVPIPSAQLTPYRVVIILRLIILGFFLQYRCTHPVTDAYPLWLTSVICEVWFALSWLLDQFPKWSPINRETYLDRLALRFEREGEPSQLAPIDVFVSTVDPLKEPPIVTANTVLSILAVDYPVDKVSCYVSDDGSAMLTFEALSETAEFARRWVPFCKKHNIEPRAPEFYFAQKIDYLKDKIQPSFVKERRAMKVSGDYLCCLHNAMLD